MYMLRYKLPLEVILNKPIEKNGYMTYKINMSDLNLDDINPNEIKNHNVYDQFCFHQFRRKCIL